MTKTTETKTTPIAELTPQQFNARFPVGTRVSVLERGKMREAITSRPAKAGHRCTVVALNHSGFMGLAFVHPITILGSLNPGDEFRWHDETPGAAVYRVKSKTGRGVVVAGFTSASDCSYDPTMLVQVVALNLAQDDRPEVFPGSMLREGDVVEMVDSAVDYVHPSQADIAKYNNEFAPLTFRGSWLHGRDGRSVPTVLRNYTFRLVPATIPAPAPTEPCPAPVEEQDERLSSDWRIIMERTPWELVAEIHKQRGWGTETARFLEVTADGLLSVATEDKRPQCAYHLLVTIENGAPQFYSEALNSAAYHAKREEIWPSVKAEPRQSYECKRCHSRNMVGLTAGHGLCGDCVAMDRWPNKPPVGADPPRKLPLAVAYHLSDEPGCTGLPEHN